MTKMVKYVDGNFIEYDILELVDFYDPILRTPTIPMDLSKTTASYVEYLIFSLTETLEKLGGLGLSANQVGLNHRICVINMGSEYWVMFNPEIIEKSDEISKFSEGCLSYPGLYINAKRSSHIKVKFHGAGGQEVIREFDGLTAVCVQHELDHLDGILYTDRISPIKLEQEKRKVKANLKKMKRARIEVPSEEIQAQN